MLSLAIPRATAATRPNESTDATGALSLAKVVASEEIERR
jgi:hypothetical protein